MTTKHTPGPWYPAYSKTNEFGGGNIRSNHHVDGDGALLFAAGPMFHDYEVNREEELANLHLVASAPELLEALERMHQALSDIMSASENCLCDSNGADDCTCPLGVGAYKPSELEGKFMDVYTLADLAITKAKGGL